MGDRVLITTADERSWPDNSEKVLFLGVWCTKIKRNHIWDKYDYKIVDPYGISGQKKIHDQEFIAKLIEKITLDLGKELNRYHGTSYSARYWNIITGHWLQRHIKVIFNRYKVIERALNTDLVNRTIKIETTRFNFNSKDGIDYIRRLSNDDWNHNVYVELFKYFPNNNIQIIEKYTHPKCKESKKQYKSYKYYIKKALSLSRFFIRDTDSVIFDTYLPKKEAFKLSFFLGQFPVYYRFGIDSYEESSVISPKRDIFFCINDGSCTGVEFAIRDLINKMIPLCYLEGYNDIYRDLKRIRLPKKPRFIFTSNAFAFNEYFKFWAAKKAENGTPYYIGQHGSNYGSLKGSEVWPEVKTCDMFLSWGWSEVYKAKTVRSFNFKVANEKQSFDSKGFGLLVERGPGHPSVPQDHYCEHELYQKYVFKFFEKIDSHVKNKITVRLHHGSNELMASDLYLWNKKYPDINIDDFSLPFKKIIQKSRLVIFSYECSGFLECMALNIPTICFWRGGTDHLFDDAADYYKMLENVGIFTNSAEKAASYVNMNWDDVDGWWNSKSIQEARIKFCSRYSRVVKNPTKMLANMLLANSKIL
jgi:putative transferase (TIGR04331 family)